MRVKFILTYKELRKGKYNKEHIKNRGFKIIKQEVEWTMAYPKDFVWGAAASAIQIEGAVTEDGKGKIFGMFFRINREKFVMDKMRIFPVIIITDIEKIYRL